jgi:hypothetical protein
VILRKGSAEGKQKEKRRYSVVLLARDGPGLALIGANLTERTPFPVREVIVNPSPRVWGK